MLLSLVECEEGSKGVEANECLIRGARSGGDGESGESPYKFGLGPGVLEEVVHYKHINEKY